MQTQDLTPLQREATRAGETSFLYGPAGTGKTTALHHRLLRLLRDGEPAYTILTLVAEPEHRAAFFDAVHNSGLGPYAELTVTDYSRLAQSMVALFWPLVARDAGFERPYVPPTSLSYDQAQVLMWRVVTPLLAQGAFANLRLRPQQIVSQLLDTLNRAALNALTLEEAIARQTRTWAGEPERRFHLDDAATAARAPAITRSDRPVAWLGSARIGKGVVCLMSAMAFTSNVLRVAVSKVRIPLSHSMICSFPRLATWSAALSHSSIVDMNPRLSNTGLANSPTAHSNG